MRTSSKVVPLFLLACVTGRTTFAQDTAGPPSTPPRQTWVLLEQTLVTHAHPLLLRSRELAIATASGLSLIDTTNGRVKATLAVGHSENAPVELPNNHLLLINRAGVLLDIPADLSEGIVRGDFLRGEITVLPTGQLVALTTGRLPVLVETDGAITFLAAKPTPRMTAGRNHLAYQTDEGIRLHGVKDGSSASVPVQTNTIAFIAFDPRDNLWIGTTEGLLTQVGSDGEILLQRTLAGGAKSVAFSHDAIYIAGQDSITALSCTGHELWTYTSTAPIATGIAASVGGLAFVTAAHQLVSVDSLGVEQWSANTAIVRPTTPILLPDGSVIVINDSGQLSLERWDAPVRPES